MGYEFGVGKKMRWRNGMMGERVRVTYPIRTAVHMQVRWQRHSSAEPENNVQRIKKNADNWNVERFEEGCRKEVQQ